MFKPSESKLQRGGRREGGRLALSGTRPAAPAGPTNARWRGGHSSTPPRHRAQPAACVNTQRTPEVQLWFFILNTQPTPAPPRLGDDEFIARRPIVWQGPPKPRCYPSTLHIKLFSSLSFAVLSLSTTHLFQPSSLCGNTMFLVCQLFGVKVYWHCGKQDTLASWQAWLLRRNNNSAPSATYAWCAPLKANFTASLENRILPFMLLLKIIRDHWLAFRNTYAKIHIYPCLSLIAQNCYSLLLKTSA